MRKIQAVGSLLFGWTMIGANGSGSSGSCQDGIQPAEWPNQDHEVCTPPPAGCPW
jgi:hypothetical protein